MGVSRDSVLTVAAAMPPRAICEAVTYGIRTPECASLPN